MDWWGSWWGWVKGRENDQVRVGRGSDPTGQQREKSAGMELARSGMQVSRRTSEGMVRNTTG